MYEICIQTLLVCGAIQQQSVAPAFGSSCSPFAPHTHTRLSLICADESDPEKNNHTSQTNSPPPLKPSSYLI